MKDRNGSEVTDKTRIMDLDCFVIRMQNCFTAANIETVGMLMSLTDDQLLKVTGFGKWSLRRVRNFQKQYSALRKTSSAELQDPNHYKIFSQFMDKLFEDKFTVFHEQVSVLKKEVAEVRQEFKKIISYLKEDQDNFLQNKDKMLDSVTQKMNDHYYSLQKAFNDFVKLKSTNADQANLSKMVELEKKISEVEERMVSLFFADNERTKK